MMFKTIQGIEKKDVSLHTEIKYLFKLIIYYSKKIKKHEPSKNANDTINTLQHYLDRRDVHGLL